MTVGYVVSDAGRWVVDTEWDASKFDLDYYGKLIGKAWDEAAFAFKFIEENVVGVTQLTCNL